MMQAPPGIFALFTQEGPPRRVSRKSVIAFGDDGAALVAGEWGSLVPAGQLAGFDRLTDSGDGPEFTALIPAGGWRIEYTWDSGTTTANRSSAGRSPGQAGSPRSTSTATTS